MLLAPSEKKNIQIIILINIMYDEHATKRVCLVQSGPHHHLIEN